MKKLALLGVFLVSTGFLGIKHTTKGTGSVVSVPNKVGYFNALEVSDNFRVTYEQGEQHSLIIEAHENLLPLIQVTQENSCLKVSVKKGKYISAKSPIHLKFQAPRLHAVTLSGSTVMTCAVANQDNILKVTLSGSASLQATQFNVEHLYAELSGKSYLAASAQKSMYLEALGASQFIGSGNANKLFLKTSGSADIKAHALFEDVEIVASGASKVVVDVSKNLIINASGSVNVMYTGSPKVQLVTSGLAKVLSV